MIKRYKKKFEESVSGTINVLDADCEYLPKIKAVILKEYKKISGIDAFMLRPWGTIRNKYDIYPEDYMSQKDVMAKALGKQSVGIVWDTVDVSFSFASLELYLHFKGYKLDKSIKVKI